MIVTYKRISTCLIHPLEAAHLGWIATEVPDIPLHPVERGSLIQQTSVGNAVIADLGASEETESAEPVLDAHVDHLARRLINQSIAWVSLCITTHVSSSMDLDDDWQTRIDRVCRDLNIEQKAVFVSRLRGYQGSVRDIPIRSGLDADWTLLRCVDYGVRIVVIVVLNGLWWPPATETCRGCSVPDAEIGRYAECLEIMGKRISDLCWRCSEGTKYR